MTDYVFDTSAWSQLFESYYRRTFRTLWEHFDEMIAEGRITSTREVAREIDDGRVGALRDWKDDHKDLFPSPDEREGDFVGRIFRVPHFRQVVSERTLLKGGKNADPFVIARAGVLDATVVTMEKLKPNSARIPNICAHFGVPCLTLEGFMEELDWEF